MWDRRGEWWGYGIIRSPYLITNLFCFCYSVASGMNGLKFRFVAFAIPIIGALMRGDVIKTSPRR